VNIEGEVIGINTAIYSGTGGNVGIGFAIPSNFARNVAETLIENGKIVRGYLGVAPENLKGYQLKEMNLTGGAVVQQVPNDGPAAMAGIKVNDVIVRIGSYPIGSQQDLRAAMLKYAPGSTVAIEIVRDGNHKTFHVKVGKVPAEQVALNQPSEEEPQTRNPLDMMPDMPNMPDFGSPGQGFGMTPQDGDVPPIRTGPAKLGVIVQTLSADLRSRYHIPAGVTGALVTSVQPGSVAERYSIMPGDIIERIGSKPIKSSQDVTEAMKGVKWGQNRQMKIVRYSSDGVVSRDMPFQFR
jgi:serine protease Do